MGLFDVQNEFVTVRMEGMDELEKRVDRMGDQMRRRGVREALKAGGNVWKFLLVNEAPIIKEPGKNRLRPPGFLKQHFSVAVRAQAGEPEGRAYIGPQGKMDYPYYPRQPGQLQGANKIKYKKGKRIEVGRIAVASVARFLEFGWDHLGGKHIAPNPFMQRAFLAGAQSGLVMEAVKAKLDEFIQSNP